MRGEHYRLSFEASPNDGLAPTAIQARVDREQNNLASFRSGVRRRIHSMDQLHRWLYAEHTAYNAAGRAQISRENTPELLESY
jgi:hypothetical protein